MTVRRSEDMEPKARRLREFVSDAVRDSDGNPLPMTMTLDQMVRQAAKAGIKLFISTESQMQAIEKIRAEFSSLIHGEGVWCYRCNQTKPADQFTKAPSNSPTRSGYNYACNQCAAGLPKYTRNPATGRMEIVD